MSELREKVARAIDRSDPGYNIRLTNLVDGVSEYTLTVGEEVHKFEWIEDAQLMGHQLRITAQADAAISAVFEHLMEPSEGMAAAARNAPRPLVFLDSLLAREDLESKVQWQAMLTKAKEEAGL